MKKTYLNILLLLFVTAVFAEQSPEIDKTIYSTDTIVWFGADFSLFRLSNNKKIGQEEKLNKYFYAWTEYYKMSISNVKMANWLSVKKVFNDKNFTDKAYKNFLSDTWIIDYPHSIPAQNIKSHINNYTSNHNGLGLTFIVESFYKGDPSMVHGYFVWFDIESKNILHIFKTNGGPSSLHAGYGMTVGTPKGLPKQKGMAGYWLNGMIESTIKFSIHHKESKPKD